jgi:hypothetical protein
MDHDSFDRLIRVLGSPGTRRSALGTLLGVGIAGTAGIADAKNKGKGKSRNKGKGKSRKKDRNKNRAQAPAAKAPAVEAEAVVCEPPRHSARLVACDYSGDDLTGVDMHSSNLKDAKFIGTNLCGADLHSSTLRNVQFDNANLTRADLHSSACGGADFTGATFCRTIGCDGDIINPICATCCVSSDCTPLSGGLVPRICQGGTCCVASGTPIGAVPGTCSNSVSLPASVCCSGSKQVGGLGVGFLCVCV